MTRRAVLPMVCLVALFVAAPLMAEMDHDHHAMHAASIDAVVAGYLSVQGALAGDSLAAAHAGARRLSEHVGMAGLDSTAAVSLKESAGLIADAANLAAARTAFGPLSQQMLALFDGDTPAMTSTPLFSVHCAMAFGGKGGDWLQADKTVSNPYYGSKMLRCGSVQAQVAGAAMGESHEGDEGHSMDHSGHNH